jgi:hypothetical protein
MPSFEAEIGQDDKTTGTFIPVPFDARTEFGRARAPVEVTVGGHVFRSTIAVYGGESLVPLNKANRTAAGVAAGDVVEVSIEVDCRPRVVELPDDLRAALDAAGLAEHWTELSFSHRREHVEWVTGAKKPETRARRIAAVVERLAAG